MELHISEEERYPFFGLHKECTDADNYLRTTPVDIPWRKAYWARRIMKEFEKVQDYLCDLYKEGDRYKESHKGG